MPDRTGDTDITISRGGAGAFLLEIVGLVGIGRLSWHLGRGGALKPLFSTLLAALAGRTWVTFRTRGFVPRGRETIVAILGPLRLIPEFGFCTISAIGFWISDWVVAATARTWA